MENLIKECRIALWKILLSNTYIKELNMISLIDEIGESHLNSLLRSLSEALQSLNL